MKDRALEQVISRLEEWAEWVAAGYSLGLGYLPTSSEYRILQGGSTRRTTPGASLLGSHPRAEEMEEWIREMAVQNPPMAQALRCHYLAGGGLRQQAKHLGISYSGMRMQLAMAQQWLAGRLSLTC